MQDEVVTRSRLKEVLRYCPVTGKFFWKVRAAHRIQVGDEAGAKANGYVRIRIDGVLYAAHRLAWLYMLGRWPTFEVDHENRIRHDNRWINLRDATHGQNSANRATFKTSRSGIKGVTWASREGKWKVAVRKNGKVHAAGHFDRIEDAEVAAIALRSRLHGEFAA